MLRFRRSPVIGIHALLLVLLSIAMIRAEQRYHFFSTVRYYGERLVVEPIQYAIDWPFRLVHLMQRGIASQHDLLVENATLRGHQLLLESKLHRLMLLERENKQLKRLLQSSNRLGAKVRVAQLLAVSLDPSLHQMVINTGQHDGVFVGQPVLDAYGVLGNVVDVGYNMSRILLLSDQKSAIPVISSRTNLQTIAVGLGAVNRLQLLYVPLIADVKVGDLFTSSGLALHYPAGYPVGTVSQVLREPGKHYLSVQLRPAAKVYQARQVLLSWPAHAALAPEVGRMLHRPVGVLKHG